MRVTRALGFSLIAQAKLWVLVVAETPVCQTDILPESVASSTRSLWCSSQISSCGTLCGGGFEENSCDASTLCYSCICSNHSSPALSSYTLTLPTFLCEQHYQNCLTSSSNDPASLKSCKEYESKSCGNNEPQTIIPSNPISILTLSTSTSTDPYTTTSDSIPITSETKTITPSASTTGTTTVLVTSTSTPGQSFGGGQGNATVSFVTTYPANLSTVVTTRRSSALSSGTATRTVSAPTVVPSNGAGKLGVLRMGEGVWMGGLLAFVWAGVGLAGW